MISPVVAKVIAASCDPHIILAPHITSDIVAKGIDRDIGIQERLTGEDKHLERTIHHIKKKEKKSVWTAEVVNLPVRGGGLHFFRSKAVLS